MYVQGEVQDHSQVRLKASIAAQRRITVIPTTTPVNGLCCGSVIDFIQMGSSLVTGMFFQNGAPKYNLIAAILFSQKDDQPAVFTKITSHGLILSQEYLWNSSLPPEISAHDIPQDLTRQALLSRIFVLPLPNPLLS